MPDFTSPLPPDRAVGDQVSPAPDVNALKVALRELQQAELTSEPEVAALVAAQLAALKGSAPAAYDTLVEIADELARGATAETALVNLIGGKLDSSPAAVDAAVTARVNDLTSALRAALSGAYLPRWTASTAYKAGAVVLAPTGETVRAKADFTSGASYVAANWDVVSGGTVSLDAWDIRSFVQAGEQLISDNSGVGNNTAVIQRAVDAANAAYLADLRPRQIRFPDGVYRLAQAGTSSGSNYAVVWKSGAGIRTSSMRGVRFMCPPTATAFFAAEAIGGISDCVFDPHVVDGALQTNATYTSKFKGWFVQGMNRCFFNEVMVVNTFSTGFGCDYLRGGTVVTGEARNCGRGIKELGIDPLTTSGGSGFGIGTGRYVVEDYTLDVRAYDCGFHGVFTETQGSEPNGLTKGSRIRAYVQGNFVGFRDCGSDGLQGEIVSRASTYAEILHDQTVLNTVSGTNGRLRVDLADGKGAGIVFGAADDGPYTFIGEIRGMAGKGVTTKSGAAIAPRLSLDLNVHHCGGDAVDLPVSTTDLRLSVRAWANTGLGLRLGGTGTATDLTLTGCDLRSGSYSITQTLAGEALVSASRGVGLSGPSLLTVLPGSSSGAIRASWSAPALDAASVTDYQVEYRTAGSTGAWTVFTHAASTSTTISITGLTAATNYEIRVAALRGATPSTYTTAALATSAGASATGVVASDDFNRADTTTGLGSAVQGGTWAYLENGRPFYVSANTAKRDGTATNGGFAWLPAITIADGSVSARILTGSAGTPGVMFRYNDASNYFWADASTGGAVRLFGRVAGSNVAMGTASGYTAGALLTLSCVGTTIKVLVDGVEKISATASANATTSGFPGLRSAAVNTGPTIYDDFSASVA